MWVLLVVALVACYVYHRLSTRRLHVVAAEVPAWKRALPIVGNLHQLYGDSEHAFQLCLQVTAEAEKRNSMLKIWFGPVLVYFISKPEDIKLVTNAFIGKPFFYKFAKAWVAEGLVTASIPVWKRHIKKVAPSFTAGVIEGFLGVFNEQTRYMVAKLKSEVGKGPFSSFRKYLAPTTLEIVCRTALGVPDMSENIVTAEYMEAFKDVLSLILKRGFNVFLHPHFIYKFTADYRRYKKCLEILHNVSTTVIQKKRQKSADAAKSKPNDKEAGSPRNFKAFLDLLLELPEEEAFTDEELRAEVDTIIVGGQETTASTLMFILLMVGGHEDVQERMYNELKEIFGDSDRPVEKEDLHRMVYIEAVIKETLRLYPPAPAVMRQADHELQLGGYKVAEGSICVVCSWAAGRWKRAWGEDAELFIPERWLERDYSPQLAAYVPFSYGRRICIGKSYAITLLKTALANTLRTLKIKADPSKLRFKADVVLRPIEGHLLEVELR